MTDTHTAAPASLAEHKAVQKALAADPRAILLYRDGGELCRLDTGERLAIADAPAAAADLLAQGQRVLVAYEPSVILPGRSPLPDAWPPRVSWWDGVVVADSGGKDSRLLTDLSVREFGAERVRLIYNLLGNEHPRAADEVSEMARHYGVPLTYTWKDRDGRSCSGPAVPEHIRALYAHDYAPSPQGEGDVADEDLVVRLAEARGQWPGVSAPLCTSTLKRDPSDKVLRAVAGPPIRKRLLRTGERAAESTSRAKKPRWQTRIATRSNLVLWERPILHVSDDELWAELAAREIPVPSSYFGLDRYSCSFCIYKSFPALCLTGLMWRRPLARRVAAEIRMGHVVNLNLRYGEHVGYQAIWAFLYGPWTGADDGRPARSEAIAQMLDWWRGGVYHRPPDGVRMLGAPEAPAGFDIAELPLPEAGATRARRRLPCGS